MRLPRYEGSRLELGLALAGAVLFLLVLGAVLVAEGREEARFDSEMESQGYVKVCAGIVRPGGSVAYANCAWVRR